MRRSSSADAPPGTDGLLPVERATLALHAADLTADVVGRRLAELVVEVGLSADAAFVPAPRHREAVAAAGEVLVEVRPPAGPVLGVLRCAPVDDEAGRAACLLAAHAGLALLSTRRLRDVEEREGEVRRISERLQDQLLPPLPTVPATSLDVDYRAAAREAKVGGDFYDVFPLRDVVGKGVEAAVRTSRITQTLRALALRELPLDRLLALADEQVVWQDPEIMATLWCGIYEPDSGELAFASLGHPPALLLRSTGEPIRLELEGLPLGMRDLSPDPPEVRTRQLEARDLLVLYTDGVVEASRDYLAGQEALQRAVEAHRDDPLHEVLHSALDELLADANHSDDAVMLLLRRR
jgi:serine phosphatase RsbU (regulator of sigma subunit)